MSEVISGVGRITAERQRQIEKEGWTSTHDDKHDDSELAWAAVSYAAPDKVFRLAQDGYNNFLFRDPWPWNFEEPESDKRNKHDRIWILVAAGALIAAEIDRLLRAKEKQ